jgi:hypothetical protein
MKLQNLALKLHSLILFIKGAQQNEITKPGLKTTFPHTVYKRSSAD